MATHKYVISFCVGLELVTAGTPTKLFSAYMAVFALVSPIGVGIGIGISSASGTGDAYTLSVAILQVFPYSYNNFFTEKMRGIIVKPPGLLTPVLLRCQHFSNLS